jgi:hypothetical protein
VAKSLIIVLLISFYSFCCAGQTGSVNVEIRKGNRTRIYGELKDSVTQRSYYPWCDVWVDDKLYDCNKNGRFSIRLKPGKYLITGRIFMHHNIEYGWKLRKGKKLK